MSGPKPPGWPDGVQPISVDDLARLGIDARNQLFWDGRRVETRNLLTLTRFQKSLAAIVTVCAILGSLGGFITGFNNATVFLCARGIFWLTCPPHLP